MDWKEILTILVPLIGLMGWVYSRIEKKADERFVALKNEMDKGFLDIKGDIKELRRDIQQLDSRVSRIEGQLTNVYWEPKIVEKTKTTKEK